MLILLTCKVFSERKTQTWEKMHTCRQCPWKFLRIVEFFFNIPTFFTYYWAVRASNFTGLWKICFTRVVDINYGCSQLYQWGKFSQNKPKLRKLQNICICGYLSVIYISFHKFDFSTEYFSSLSIYLFICRLVQVVETLHNKFMTHWESKPFGRLSPIVHRWHHWYLVVNSYYQLLVEKSW